MPRRFSELQVLPKCLPPTRLLPTCLLPTCSLPARLLATRLLPAAAIIVTTTTTRFIGAPLGDMIRSDVKPALMTAIEGEFAKCPKQDGFTATRTSRAEVKAAAGKGGAGGGKGERGVGEGVGWRVGRRAGVVGVAGRASGGVLGTTNEGGSGSDRHEDVC